MLRLAKTLPNHLIAAHRLFVAEGPSGDTPGAGYARQVFPLDRTAHGANLALRSAPGLRHLFHCLE
jgi:hypothetical protein